MTGRRASRLFFVRKWIDRQMHAPVLISGPYKPLLLKGNHTVCLARDCDVVITDMSNGRIAWPRCRALDTHGGESGILPR